MNSYSQYTKLFATVIMTSFILAACNQTNTKQAGPKKSPFNIRSLAKSDIGIVIEIHVQETRSYLRALMVKLYMRNPRELKKSEYPTAAQNIERIFNQDHNWNFPELDGNQGIDAIRLTFSDDYKGDRVFTFMAGLSSMIMASYNHKTEFYLLDSVNPQNLYNSARNIEIAVWRLGHEHDSHDELFLYSNSQAGEVTNLSYARLFGKLIALQDTIAVIIAGKTNRTLIRVIQRIASAIFLPIL